VRDDLKYLLYIRENIRRIEEDTARGRALFDASHTVQDAVLHNLQLLAESTKRLSTARKEAHPGVDWRGIAGFRNFLVHDYMSVDLEVVWRIVEEDLPQLKAAVDAMLNE
jgi:uncharacterized protein with HEPN domain